MTSAEVVSSFLGSTTVFQILLILVLCNALKRSGVGEVIAKFIVTRKFIQGRPLLFLGAYLFAMFISGIFINTSSAIPFFFPIWDSICQNLGYEKQDKLNKFMLLGTYLFLVLGSFVIPFYGMVPMYVTYFNNQLASTGFVFEPTAYMVSVICVALLLLVAYVLTLKLVFRCDFDKIKGFDISKLEGFERQNIRLDHRQKIMFLAFFIVIAYSISLMFIPQTLFWYASYKGFSLGMVTLLILAILGIYRKDGHPFLHLESAFGTGVQWSIIFLLGSFSIVGNALGVEELGITQWITKLVGPIFGNLAWPTFVIVSVALCAIVTNFMSNMATAMMVFSVVTPFAVRFMEQGINISVLGAAITYSSMFAYMTYSSFYCSAMLLDHEAIDSKFIFTKGLTPLILYIIIASIIFTLFGYVL